METSDLIKLGFGIIGVCLTLLGWILRALWEEHKSLVSADKELAKRVNQIELLVTGEYIKKSDFDRTSTAIFNKLDKIYDRLDTKVDKPTHFG